MPLGKHQARPMVFLRTDAGCLVCISHKANPDGYLRKSWGNARTGDRVMEMFHRFIYRAHRGEIPEGHEVDHECNVRACCEPSHLVALAGKEHTVKTNSTRYAERTRQAKAYWRCHTPTGTELALRFGVSIGNACGWIRRWKHEASNA